MAVRGCHAWRVHSVACGAVILAGIVAASGLESAQAATPCEDLAHATTLPHVTITAAQSVSAGTFQPPGSPAAFTDLPAFCRVTATVSPVPGSSIGIEVWLPATIWNGRYQQVGNHGWAGVIYWSEMAPQLRRGFATGATDDGHVNTTGDPFYIDWAVGHPVRIDDMAWRAVHELAENAKHLIALFYDERLRASYFNGCSDGGREGLREAHDFPGDFDGIIAGGAAAYWTHAATQQLVLTRNLRDGGLQDAPGAARLALVQAATTAACDAADGVSDGLIANPVRCLWNPHAMVCKPGTDPATCLTPAQADALAANVAPVRNREGRWVFSGLPAGSEFETIRWKYSYGLAPFGLSNYRIAFQDPSWDGSTFDLARDLPRLDAALGVMNMTDTDLRPFAARGGKLIQYHGWNDGAFTAGWATAYYDAVTHDMAYGSPAGVTDFFRLFMMPGVGHCAPRTDIGPDNIGSENQMAVSPDREHDVVTALTEWVEHGTAPDRLIATRFKDNHPGQGIEMQRPIYPYPAEAVWNGKGSTNEASSFHPLQPDAAVLHESVRHAQ